MYTNFNVQTHWYSLWKWNSFLIIKNVVGTLIRFLLLPKNKFRMGQDLAQDFNLTFIGTVKWVSRYRLVVAYAPPPLWVRSRLTHARCSFAFCPPFDSRAVTTIVAPRAFLSRGNFWLFRASPASLFPHDRRGNAVCSSIDWSIERMWYLHVCYFVIWKLIIFGM